jgi:sphingosine kinase
MLIQLQMKHCAKRSGHSVAALPYLAVHLPPFQLQGALSDSSIGNKTTRSIPFYNILWAEHSDDGDITIQYAHVVSKTVVRPAIISYTLDKADNATTSAWIETLLKRAYGASLRQKRLKVLVNPFGGQGNGLKIYHKHIAPIFAAARCELDVEQTKHNGHGVEIAQNLDIEKYDVVACCSGDGIPHEVWNGLSKREDAARALVKIAVAQLPCGSGNAMSLNFNGTDSPSLAALAVVKGLRTPLDLVSVTQGDNRMLSFLSQSVGIVAETDLATENLRWMGSARFTWGFLVRLIRQTIYPADIAVKVEYDNKAAIRDVYRAESAKPPRTHDDRTVPAAGTGLPSLKYGTVNDPLPEGWTLVPHDKLGNFYAGNLAYMSPDANFFPASLPSDGCMDLIRIRGDIKRHTAIATLLAIADHKFFDLPHVDYQKISAYRIIPKNQKDGYISIDGERVPFEPFQAEVHRGLGTVLSKSGHMFEAKGV